MGNGLMQIGELMLSISQQRLNAVSNNIANATTPGFKASQSFATLLTESSDTPALEHNIDPGQGALRATGRSLDFAIAGEGFFRLSDGSDFLYTRAGAFERDAEGKLVDAQGRAVQSSEGGDVIISSSNVEILSDGVVLDNGAPIARIGVFQADWTAVSVVGGGHFSIDDAALRETGPVNLRQGMLEAANVDLTGEMMQMMSALRIAEVGARVVQTYDGLVGQAISTFQRDGR